MKNVFGMKNNFSAIFEKVVLNEFMQYAKWIFNIGNLVVLKEENDQPDHELFNGIQYTSI